MKTYDNNDTVYNEVGCKRSSDASDARVKKRNYSRNTIEWINNLQNSSVKETVYIYICFILWIAILLFLSFFLSFLLFLFSSWNCRVIINDLQERETKVGNDEKEREKDRERHSFSFSQRIFSVKLTVGNPNGRRVIARVSRGNEQFRSRDVLGNLDCEVLPRSRYRESG